MSPERERRGERRGGMRRRGEILALAFVMGWI
jgi:hypothetical protein